MREGEYVIVVDLAKIKAAGKLRNACMCTYSLTSASLDSVGSKTLPVDLYRWSVAFARSQSKYSS